MHHFSLDLTKVDPPAVMKHSPSFEDALPYIIFIGVLLSFLFLDCAIRAGKCCCETLVNPTATPVNPTVDNFVLTDVKVVRDIITPPPAYEKVTGLPEYTEAMAVNEAVAVTEAVAITEAVNLDQVTSEINAETAKLTEMGAGLPRQIGRFQVHTIPEAPTQMGRFLVYKMPSN
jgi:hypothetical protein